MLGVEEWDMMKSKRVRLCLGAVLFSGAVVALAGCPKKNTDTQLTVLFTGDSSPVMKALVAILEGNKQGGTIPVDDIEALYVDIVEVVLDHSPGGGEGEGEGEGNESKITVFPQEDGPESLRVNIKDLIEVSRVLSEVEVPSGKYTKIRLSIDNPELVFVDDVETSFTNIGLTANSRLFISEMFELPEGESSLIVLDFGGVKVNQLGNGDFQLTPQLDVDVSVEAASIALSGPVTEVSGTSLTVMTEEQGDVTVIITEDTALGDSDGTMLDIMDIADEVMAGDNVTVVAEITVDGLDGDVTATSVTINL